MLPTSCPNQAILSEKPPGLASYQKASKSEKATTSTISTISSTTRPPGTLKDRCQTPGQTPCCWTRARIATTDPRSNLSQSTFPSGPTTIFSRTSSRLQLTETPRSRSTMIETAPITGPTSRSACKTSEEAPSVLTPLNRKSPPRASSRAYQTKTHNPHFLLRISK